ncbi:pectinesterase family protein [Epilithonimonas ginsengisoli]|uniref:Pectinesterase n=1 Tax=Epilithonimonas ginsengisoli TaxID=1245592 RepID=A0ABU4JF68_9FLAO|nr:MULTISPECIES: pectinesterase family protein [Chryseobacterium group]MBV6879693.1 pectin esterase [Epilithonimonas sp. FP105]MDW8548332.1 pectinesterase family protein [Epilithonimonas ginsengisoli]OAH72565.1 pectin esterase [Chryseobacterium sp. FP211-J200]
MKRILSILMMAFVQIVLAQNTPYITVNVASDGSGQFTSIHKAINSVRDFGPGEALIKIKAGTYKEKIVIPSSKHKVTLQGENAENTMIVNDDYSGKIDALNEKMTTFNSYTLLVMADEVKISNLTIQNISCSKGQAVSLHVEGDKFVIKDSKILGCQDTVYATGTHSRQYYENCFIEGTTDFIFGSATVVFKNCTIKSLANSYVTAASTDQNKKYGFVFFDCKLIAKDGITKVFLGRPWRSYARTVFINTEMGNHILPEGWNPWKGDAMFPDKEKTTYYAEFGSRGEGANTAKRVSWSHQLTKKKVKSYTIEKIFGDWNPIQY